MNVEDPDPAVSAIASAIGEPARSRMLYSLLDGRARTSTELAVLAGVTPSTASVHLHRLKSAGLVKLSAQGKHRYYSLDGSDVADALEALSVLAGGTARRFEPTAPNRLRAARTCYDHIAGTLGVALHDRFMAMRWFTNGDSGYDLTTRGSQGFTDLGIDVDSTRALRRRFAFGCLDWSERRPHVGGALAAAFMTLALKRGWVTADLDSRLLTVTKAGVREMKARFGVVL